jgi:hypothetical protein
MRDIGKLDMTIHNRVRDIIGVFGSTLLEEVRLILVIVETKLTNTRD